jgi:hypothetical protein
MTDVNEEASMGRSHLALTFTALFPLVLAITTPAQVTAPKLLERAKEIQRRIIAFDSHLDLPFDYPKAKATLEWRL